MVDNIFQYSKFPNPPRFKNAVGKKCFEVPKYYGFDHPCTKWLLACIVSNQALFRLLKVASIHRGVMKRYHQIPDRPGLIMKERYNIERAAFNHQAILYLTPLSLAIYMRYDDALSHLVTLKDCNGKTIVDPNDMCFVQNFWRKGESRYFTDLIATFPAIIAIRRNYLSAFTYLLMAGYCPNNSFSLTYRKPHREIIIAYKDLIDYVMDYLKSRPAFNAGRLMHVLLQTSKDCDNKLDIFCFDYLPTSQPNVVSLFQRVARMSLDDENMSEENGMHIINVLEKIQEAGFFHGMPVSSMKTNTAPRFLEDMVSEKVESKIYVDDLFSMNNEERESILERDYRHCISYIMLWLITRSLRRRTEQNIHLLNMLTKILFDTKYISIFFKVETQNTNQLCQKLGEFPNMSGKVDEKVAIVIRDHVVHLFRQSEQMIVAFISRYKMEPNDAFLGSQEVVDTFRYTWIKSELADYSFRNKYLSNKDKQVKVVKENDLFKHELPDEPELMRFSGGITPPGNNNDNVNNISGNDPKKEYFFVSSKARKIRSCSIDNYRRKQKIVFDKSMDVTIKSFQSFDTKDQSESLSVSSIVDFNRSTMIEIDLTTELKTMKRLYQEVIVNDDDIQSEFTNCEVMGPTLINGFRSESIPPPLTNRRER